jgi:O-acetyl-ADP-ribose deacetylase (regulator of RNase III)
VSEENESGNGVIEFRRDNLLEADAEALVNTVNTVGVMGKGIALQFKKKFWENFKAYERACKNDEVEIGKMFTFPLDSLTNPRYIINFPTKRHWRERSRVEYVREGLEDLLREIERLDIRSIALPPLGCGNGGLDWETEVRPLIEAAFARMPEVEVHAYEPSTAAKPVTLDVKGPKPDLTPARAVMLNLIGAYKASHYALGRLVAQKLAYLAQTVGEPSLALEFKESKYGPYAENLNFLLQNLEGHYLTGYGDRSSKSDIELVPGAEREAGDFLQDYPETEERLEKVTQLIEGFETPYGMELLATVHWAVSRKGATSLEEAVRIVREWNPRKGDLFDEQHVRVAWERLEEEGWLPLESAVRS